MRSSRRALMSFFNSAISPSDPTTAGFLAVADIGELPAHRQEAAAALFVDLAGVLLLRVDIGLVALQHPLDVRQFDAAVLNAAVRYRAGQLVLQLQLEIGRVAVAPDDRRCSASAACPPWSRRPWRRLPRARNPDRSPTRRGSCRRRSAGSRSLPAAATGLRASAPALWPPFGPALAPAVPGDRCASSGHRERTDRTSACYPPCAASAPRTLTHCDSRPMPAPRPSRSPCASPSRKVGDALLPSPPPSENRRPGG